MTSSNKQKPLNVKLPSDLEPFYSNFAMISHTPSEIIVDFAQALPNQPEVRIKTRVVMTPLNAKLFMRALQENLAKYEKTFGEISTPGQGDDLTREFFSGVRPPGDE